MEISVCVGAVFSGHNFYDGLEKVAEMGFGAFEFWSWENKDIERIKQKKEELDLKLTAFCTREFNLVDPALRSQYLQGLKESIEIAQTLECSGLISQVGNEMDDVPREKQHRSVVEGLKECVPLLEDSNITLLIEPLNILVDQQGYFLYDSDEAFAIVDEVDSDHVKILYDVYHQQITEGNLINTINNNINNIGHFHAAGNPGRHELTDGEINYESVFKAIEKTGFEGYLGLEYFPVREPETGLKEIKTMLKYL